MRETKEPRNKDTGFSKIVYRVIDPSAFKQDGGPSIVERMEAPPYRLAFIRADNKRIAKLGALGGWDQVRSRLKGNGDRPTIYFMDCCKDAIRTLPALQHSETNIEDVDTTGEDHAPDEIRYACMSRPYASVSENEDFRAMLRAKDNTAGIIINDYFEEFADDFDSKFNDMRIF